MAKLTFYYSTMNAGKSTHLLQNSYNYHEKGFKTLLFTSCLDDRYKKGTITSRIGLSSSANEFDDMTSFIPVVKNLASKPECLFIDEAQFLTKRQVRDLMEIAHLYDVPVKCFGLRTDFKGNLFEGSQCLLAWADVIKGKRTVCECGGAATMNARLDKNGERVLEGDQIQIGGNDIYITLCPIHFWGFYK